MNENEKPLAKREHDYLKFYRIVSTYYRIKHNLEQSELDMLLFLYSEPYFDYENFKEYEQIMPWDNQRFSNLKKMGFIETIRNRTGSHRSVYRISRKGRYMIASMYKTLEGEIDISLHRVLNPMVRVNNSYRDKVYINAIKLMRRKVSAHRQRGKGEDDEPTDPTQRQ